MISHSNYALVAIVVVVVVAIVVVVVVVIGIVVVIVIVNAIVIASANKSWLNSTGVQIQNSNDGNDHNLGLSAATTIWKLGWTYRWREVEPLGEMLDEAHAC